MFSLGAIVYRALTGRAAFPGRTPAAALHEVLNEEPPPPSRVVEDLPADVDVALALAMALRPEDRYASAGAFALDLARAAMAILPQESRARADARLLRSAGAGKTLA